MSEGREISVPVETTAQAYLELLRARGIDYFFSVPTAAHMVSATCALPTLTVVFNNGCWGAVRKTTAALFPEGWAAKTGQFPLSDLSPAPAYEKIVEAHGGYGEKVERPEEVRPALRRALAAVMDEGRQAVLNVICRRE